VGYGWFSAHAMTVVEIVGLYFLTARVLGRLRRR
jgi:hypothetical protein